MAKDEFGGWEDFGAAGRQRTLRSSLAAESAEPKPPYDAEAALLCAIASTWAYSDARTLERTLDRSVFPGAEATLIEVQNSARLIDTQVFVVRQPERERTIVAFRGTEIRGDKVTDMLTDMLVAPVEFPRGSSAKVHRGFLHGLIAVWPDLVEALTEHPAGDLYITGHSLGGALASLMAVMLCLELTGVMQAEDRPQRDTIRERVRGVHTFGQPMIGSPDFARLATQRLGMHDLLVVRHVFDHDVIPHLPGRDAGPFAHFGAEMMAHEDSPTWTETAQGAVGQAKRSLGALVTGFLDFAGQQFAAGRRYELSSSLSDHMPQHYVDICKRHVFKGRPIPFYP